MNVSSQVTRRGPLVPTILVLAALVTAFVIFSEVWTTKLWFDSVGYPRVFGTQLLAQVLLFGGFFLAMAAIGILGFVAKNVIAWVLGI